MLPSHVLHDLVCGRLSMRAACCLLPLSGVLSVGSDFAAAAAEEKRLGTHA